MKIVSSDIAKIIKGKLIGPPNLLVSEIVIDSRQLSYTEGLIFIAISGKNHDGHLFIDNLYQKGIRIFVVERLPDETDRFPGAAFIITNNTVEALQLLASYKRKAFKSPVIAVTGSAGKTVVKEWLADILGLAVSVIRSPKSYNSQVGVPLSVWKLDDKYKLGIFEAGISLPGEMEKLQKVIDPDIGVITNIGDAHRENFPDNMTKASEKLKLFVNASLIVYCSDHELIKQLIWNNENFNQKYANEIIDQIEARGISVRDRLESLTIRTPSDLEQSVKAPGGSIYGTSSNGARAAFLRAKNRSPIKNLYCVGGSAHPGGGLPLVGMSGEIVANAVGRAHSE